MSGYNKGGDFISDLVNSGVVTATKNTVNQINLQCKQRLNSDSRRLDFHECGEHFKLIFFVMTSIVHPK
jgi:hypothetical protein